MTTFKAEVFELTIGGYTHVIEFTRDSLKEADSMGVTSADGMGAYDRTRIVLFAGLKKHNAFITLKRAGEILDAALDEGYGLDSFGDLIDEFTRCYKAVFTESGEKKKAPLLIRRSQQQKNG